jgi:hypothetical protein
MIRKLDVVSGLIASGQLRVGMIRSELLDILGPPDATGGASRKYREDCIYKYGDVQFVFPTAASARDTELHGLLYAYVDDDVDGVDEPLFLLR